MSSLVYKMQVILSTLEGGGEEEVSWFVRRIQSRAEAPTSKDLRAGVKCIRDKRAHWKGWHVDVQEEAQTGCRCRERGTCEETFKLH